jgi:hypothetical protein
MWRPWVLTIKGAGISVPSEPDSGRLIGFYNSAFVLARSCHEAEEKGIDACLLSFRENDIAALNSGDEPVFQVVGSSAISWVRFLLDRYVRCRTNRLGALHGASWYPAD